MRPYTPSNEVPNSGFTWLTVTALVGGVAIGGVASFAGQFFYLIILFPVLMGAGGGFLQSYAVNQGKVRNPLIAGTFAILMGVIVCGTMHGGDYLSWKEKDKQSSNFTEEEIDNLLLSETGSKGFLGYQKFLAQQGVGITRGSSKVELKNEWAWGYWAIELAIISGITAFMAFAAAKEPFCENSDEWYLPKEPVGSIPKEESENFLGLIKNENFVKAGALIDPQNLSPIPNMVVHLQRSPGDRMNDYILSASKTSLDNKGNVSAKEVIQGMISPSQHAQLEQAVKANLQQNEAISDPESGTSNSLS